MVEEFFESNVMSDTTELGSPEKSRKSAPSTAHTKSQKFFDRSSIEG